MHVDGSILKDLPVDTMKNILSFTKNKVIAILISATMGAIDQKKYYFPYKLSWFQGLLHKLGIGKKKYIFPDPINDYFMRTAGLGGNSSVAANAMLADILIELDLQTFPLLEVNDEQITQLINIGYEVTLAKLRDSKQDILEYQ